VLRRITATELVKDRGEIRSFLDQDPVGNAVVWDRVFQQDDYRIYVYGSPPRGLIAIRLGRRERSPNFIVLHALDVEAAGALCGSIPAGFTILHLTEEFSLPILETRAAEFRPRPAWLFRLDPADFVDHADGRIKPLEPRWADRVAKLWEPEWPAEQYVRERIQAGPTAAIYEDGEPVAWALTHMVTDKVAIVGMVHVLAGYRRKGLARSVVAAVSRDLIRLGKIPALHAYVDNTASLALFPTLGFRKVRRQVWGEAVFR
jgi:GNAT superfamily N-acetyltransferase